VSVISRPSFASLTLLSSTLRHLSPDVPRHYAERWQPIHDETNVRGYVRQNIIHAEMHFYKRDSNPCRPSNTQ
jgi:hypothetical protein